MAATKTRKARGPARDHYQEITDRIVAALESGDDLAPWQKPWQASPYGSAPHNPMSGTTYRGINTWLTLMVMWERGYDHPMFLTYKQANEIAAKAYRKAGRKVELRTMGRRKFWAFADGDDKGKSCGGIRSGQNKENDAGGTSIIFWKRGTRTVKDDNGNEEQKGWATLRTFVVFNVAQCDDIVREYHCPPVVAAPEITPL